MSLDIIQSLRSRLWLVLAVCAALVCYALLPALTGLQRLLISWNVLAWLYLGFLWRRMLMTRVEQIPHIARQLDQSASLVLTLVTLACMASVVAIFSELSTLKHLSGTPKALHMLLTATTIVVSWTLLPSAFAMHYAHHHYLNLGPNTTPLLFPEKPDKPGYWDFIYFSFTIAAASQTADVATGTTDIRKITLLQTVVSFVFNLVILGLSVNVAAGLLN